MRCYAAAKAITYDQIITFPQLRDERLKPTKIIRIVCVAHDHISTARGVNACYQRGAVASVCNAHDPCPGGRGKSTRIVA